MKPDGASAQVQCPACKELVTVPISLRTIGRTTAKVGFDLSAVRAHVDEHAGREEPQRGHP